MLVGTIAVSDEVKTQWITPTRELVHGIICVNRLGLLLQCCHIVMSTMDNSSRGGQTSTSIIV